MRAFATRSFVLGPGLLVAVACRGPALLEYEAELAATPASAVHAVHEERLVTVMRDMERLRRARLPKPIDPQADARERASEVARVAEALAASATRIVAAAPPGLNAEQADLFRAFAESLREASLRFAEEAFVLPQAEHRARWAEIDATCQGCHGRFRIPGVDGMNAGTPGDTSTPSAKE